MVLTKNRGFFREGALTAGSVEKALEILKDYGSQQVFIAGGGHIYREFLPFCHTAYVTRVYKDFEADTFFPDLDMDPEWELSFVGERMEHEGLAFAFTTYKRK